jgi:electron transfer flavoprotein alpha subunit
MLSPSTLWGREIAARVAARLGAGLTGDAIGMELENDRLIAWKPAFGGRLVAAITSDSDVQMVTLRPGALPLIEPRIADAAVTRVAGSKRSRVRILQRHREDTVNGLAAAVTVVGVGTGVPVDEYERVQPLLDCLGAELAATRKVTDLGWLPRSRQVGLTGLSISPRLYIAIGLSGNINHSVGIRRAGTVLAINTDRKAGILKQADVSIIADWREVVPILCAELSKTLKDAKGDHAGNRMHGDEVRVLSA